MVICAYFYFAAGRGSKYCEEYVCLSVRLSTCNTRKQHSRTTPIFLCMLRVAVVRFSFGSVAVALCYVLPVLWMTSCFHGHGWRLLYSRFGFFSERVETHGIHYLVIPISTLLQAKVDSTEFLKVDFTSS